ncbi:MAG: bifunctional DNA-formamidopyrimidine glycosylase/DNA-(apurinic or apyrimidinic site) lyase [Gammaproteobacteria bacterium]|nr:bifunctional DNA-formamidopyrimidine glycosylase/DNA-(apurinic or apyrimidinic site) lyase [Gammaproteobacteria bacterium]
MPELPEVETTRRGIAPHILGRRLERLTVRQPCLRWPIPANLARRVRGQAVESVERRAKYLLLRMSGGTLLIHLGMSGSLRILNEQPIPAPGPHDHFDLDFSECVVRFRDPRRFGALLWTSAPAEQHLLLSHLGPEPLSDEFDERYLYSCSRGRQAAVKNLIMDGKIVVGVGNIYANESLFLSGIHPQRASNRISLVRYRHLASNIKQVLQNAIEQGGTTLRDFHNQEGNPGYFAQRLLVYGKSGDPCPNCGTTIQQRRIGQRSSFFCVQCQR